MYTRPLNNENGSNKTFPDNSKSSFHRIAGARRGGPPCPPLSLRRSLSRTGRGAQDRPLHYTNRFIPPKAEWKAPPIQFFKGQYLILPKSGNVKMKILSDFLFRKASFYCFDNRRQELPGISQQDIISKERYRTLLVSYLHYGGTIAFGQVGNTGGRIYQG